MSEPITNSGLKFRSGYYAEPAGRAALNDLVREIFGADFTPWNDLGRDCPEYMPFSFFDGDRVIANVSASPMEIVVGGTRESVFQIGTVAVRTDHRGRGLARELIERAHAHWEALRPVSFLFSNEETAGLYERMGYRRVPESRFAIDAPPYQPAAGARKLDPRNPADVALFERIADRRAPVSERLGVVDHTWLLLYKAAVPYPDHVAYVEPLGAVVFSKTVDDRLHLIDVVGERVPALDELYPYIGAPEVQAVEFGFTPDRMGAENARAVPDEDSLFFVRGDLEIETPFRFPATGEA